jgi:transcription termination factor NusB
MTQEELNQKVKKAAKDSNLVFSSQDAEDAIEFVRDLVEAMIDHCEENEPQATNYIDKMRTTMYQIDNLRSDDDLYPALDTLDEKEY